MAESRDPPITHQDINAYRKDGFLICRWPPFSEQKLFILQEIGHEYMLDIKKGRRPADLNVPHFDDSRLFEFILDPYVLDQIERFIGSDIAIWSSQFFCKPTQDGKAIPWHADSYYWQKFMRPVDVISVFIALNDNSQENGCLRLLPGSHHGEKFNYQPTKSGYNPFFPLGVNESAISDRQIVDIEIKAGQFVLFDGNLLHGSNANHSNTDRSVFTMRYSPTSCKFSSMGIGYGRSISRLLAGTLRYWITGQDYYVHRVYLARGADRGNNKYTDLP